MQFWQIAGGFLVAFIVMNTWKRIKWRFGFEPEIYDETQANIAAKECARAYANQVAEQVEKNQGLEMPPQAKQQCEAEIYELSKRVIYAYAQRMLTPKFDLIPNPTRPS